jgi:hypothetical protein
MSHPWTVDDEPTASTQQGMQAASGVSFLRARHAAALTADTIRACSKGGLVWLGVRRAKEEEDEEVVKEL